MGDYRRLRVWQAAYRLALGVYRVTGRFPAAERYGLTAPCRRAAVSVVANIAEGAGRGSEAEGTRFLWIARGSAQELQVELALGRDLGMAPADDVAEVMRLAADVGAMLTGVLKARGATPRRNRPSKP